MVRAEARDDEGVPHRRRVADGDGVAVARGAEAPPRAVRPGSPAMRAPGELDYGPGDGVAPVEAAHGDREGREVVREVRRAVDLRSPRAFRGERWRKAAEVSQSVDQSVGRSRDG